MDWDDPLTDIDREALKNLTQDLNKLSTVTLSRFIGNGVSQLFCFCYSSNKAYAVVNY